MTALNYKNREAGLTLIELMVTLVVSLVIVIAAASFFLGSSQTRTTQEAASTLQDNARFATEIITRSIQQAGYQDYIWNSAGGNARRERLAPADGEPDLRGYNNTAAAGSGDNGVHNRSANRVNNSDTLVLRYQGQGSPNADGSMIDCRGSAQAAPAAAGDRAYSIFEIRQTGDEPELKCKFFNAATSLFTSELIVRGVETLQFMYGVDTVGSDSFVDRWQNAEEVSAAGSATPITDWARVKSVRVGMVLRSPVGVSVPTSGTMTLSPLGVNFSQNVNDTLTVNNADGRLRKVVTFTVNLRNAL